MLSPASPFAAIPAAVCPLDRWLKDETLQAIAAENNLAETAYYVRENGRYRLRWFTPTVEVDLCGHATLAAAYVILELRRETAGDTRRWLFDSRSGELTVARENDLYVLDFPSRIRHWNVRRTPFCSRLWAPGRPNSCEPAIASACSRPRTRSGRWLRT